MLVKSRALGYAMHLETRMNNGDQDLTKTEPTSEVATERDTHDLLASAVHAIESADARSKLLGLAMEWMEQARDGKVSAATVRALVQKTGLDEDALVTPLGNVEQILVYGAEDEKERALGDVLTTMAIVDAWAREDAEPNELAAMMMAISARTDFDVLRTLDRIMGDDAELAWKTIARRIQKYDARAAFERDSEERPRTRSSDARIRTEKSKAPSSDARIRATANVSTRAEIVLACAALRASTNTSAMRARESLSLKDPVLRQIVNASAPVESEVTELRGEIVRAPSGPIVTSLLALSGLLFVIHITRFVLRIALVYRTPAQATFSREGIVVHSKSVLLGRTLRETETRIARESVAQATREIRFPRLGLYAGLLALALGSYVGVSTLGDGIRSASPSLLLTGLLLVAIGIGLDLALTSALPGSRGTCRVLLVTSKGRSICIGYVDAARADRALSSLRA